MRFGKLFLFLVVPLLACSAVCPKIQSPGVELAKLETSYTAALIYPSFSNRPFCSAVWVSKDILLTANHCVIGLTDRINESFRSPSDDESSRDIIDDLIPKIKPMDVKIPYIVQNEYTSYGQMPAAIHYSRVIYLSSDTDLALLAAINPDSVPNHGIAQLAKHTPAVGEKIEVMGHPIGLVWTYLEGLVASYRDSMGDAVAVRGPFLQASVAANHGNSGGGIFNSDGELCGIASFMAPIPNTVFFIHLDTIRALLIGQEIVKK